VFARSLKAAIAGIRSPILPRRRVKLREPMSTPYKGDQSVQRMSDLRRLGATDQRNAHDLNALLSRNGMVS
jgi:hypothetical protein